MNTMEPAHIFSWLLCTGLLSSGLARNVLLLVGECVRPRRSSVQSGDYSITSLCTHVSVIYTALFLIDNTHPIHLRSHYIGVD